jgi:hypothetical protein
MAGRAHGTRSGSVGVSSVTADRRYRLRAVSRKERLATVAQVTDLRVATQHTAQRRAVRTAGGGAWRTPVPEDKSDKILTVNIRILSDFS